MEVARYLENSSNFILLQVVSKLPFSGLFYRQIDSYDGDDHATAL